MSSVKKQCYDTTDTTIHCARRV